MTRCTERPLTRSARKASKRRTSPGAGLRTASSTGGPANGPPKPRAPGSGGGAWGMCRRGRPRLTERYRRLRRRLAVWRRRDPKPWVVALIGVALGFGLFVLLLSLVALTRIAADVTKPLR